VNTVGEVIIGFGNSWNYLFRAERPTFAERGLILPREARGGGSPERSAGESGWGLSHHGASAFCGKTPTPAFADPPRASRREG